MDTCIAVDIGGTKMLIAQVLEDGTIVNQKRYPTGQLNKQEVLEKLIQGVYDYEKEIGWGIRWRCSTTALWWGRRLWMNQTCCWT